MPTLYEVSFSVDVLQAKQRPRFDTRGHRTYTPTKTREAEARIATAYKGASIRRYGRVVKAPRGVPVALEVRCLTGAPTRYPDWLPDWLRPRMPFTKRPDWDNLGKTVTDGLNGVAYHDDSQVVAAHVYKLDMVPGGRDRVDVTLQFHLMEE